MNAIPAPVDRRDVALYRAFAGEISVREQALIARKTDSEPPHPVCAWCPDFQPTAAAAGVSHGICPRCEARIHADLDRQEASRTTSQNSQKEP